MVFNTLLVTFHAFNPARDYPEEERKGVFSSEKTPSGPYQIPAPCSAFLSKAVKSDTFGHFLVTFGHFSTRFDTFWSLLVTFWSPEKK